VKLALAIYRLTSTFPGDERFGLTAQLRRCGVSMASNVAEGYGRGTTAEYLRFLRFARGSLCETDTQLVIVRELGYVSDEQLAEIETLAEECGRLLAALIRSLERTQSGTDQPGSASAQSPVPNP
jgi:four helix bundle protein